MAAVQQSLFNVSIISGPAGLVLLYEEDVQKFYYLQYSPIRSNVHSATSYGIWHKRRDHLLGWFLADVHYLVDTGII